MLTLAQIHQMLVFRFAAAIAPLAGETPGTEPDIQIDPAMLHLIVQELIENPALACTELYAIDSTPHANGCTLRYTLASARNGHKVTLSIEIGESHPVVLTLRDLYCNAGWYEDEIENSCAILFQTHPQCTNSNCRNHGIGTRCRRLTAMQEVFQP